MKLKLTPGHLAFEDIVKLADEKTTIELDKSCLKKINAAEKFINESITTDKIIYGVNTGFGLLAHTKISNDKLSKLQESLLLSHAAGTGKNFSDKIVRLMLALKINSLARGFSGVKLETIDAFIKLYNEKIYPCIPEKGSVGASGDLAPLAHLSIALLGVGNVKYKNQTIPAKDALKAINLAPLKLGPKEGLALINGTQASTASAIVALIETENLFTHAITAGAMSTDAILGSDKPFDPRIQQVRGHESQIKVAKLLCDLLKDSEIRKSHKNCNKVQDPYSVRCQPQVMGACLAQIEFAKKTLLTEANAVSDNPLVFADDNEIISGGNFHAEPAAFAADNLALAIAEIGALSERRIALFMDQKFSNLPAFLVKDAGLNSGFMIAQVTAAALASENKSLAHPASVDSLPTSANQEDHVSMATFAANRLFTMIENSIGIIAIELLAAAQAIDFLRPLKTSFALEEVHAKIRAKIKFYDKDRFFAPDIEAMRKILL